MSGGWLLKPRTMQRRAAAGPVDVAALPTFCVLTPGSLPRAFVSRCNSMNEVWVPSAWAVEVFAASGVDPAKLVVLPEGINTTW